MRRWGGAHQHRGLGWGCVQCAVPSLQDHHFLGPLSPGPPLPEARLHTAGAGAVLRWDASGAILVQQPSGLHWSPRRSWERLVRAGICAVRRVERAQALTVWARDVSALRYPALDARRARLTFARFV